MATLTVTARGQVTFRKEVLKHLGIKPGEKIELNLLPQGKAELKAAGRVWRGDLRFLRPEGSYATQRPGPIHPSAQLARSY
jgi:bifunctional DNA-binding transcriptional regulator/antitoxin component of YhaV-PrlF toxin-antitoxin module